MPVIHKIQKIKNKVQLDQIKQIIEDRQEEKRQEAMASAFENIQQKGSSDAQIPVQVSQYVEEEKIQEQPAKNFD